MRIKVAHVITRLDLGGAQQNTLHTVRTLDRARFEPVLVCGEGGLLDAEVRADRAIRAVWLPSLTREVSPVHDLMALLELVKCFQAERPDVVHTHSSKAGILGRLAAAWCGVPVVVHTYHGFGFHDRQHPWVKRLYVALERLCARFTTRLVFVSQSNARYAEAHGLGRAEGATIIRSGVRLADFPARVDADALKMTAGIGRHKLLVVSIGNLKPQKNAGDFVAAAAKAAAKVPDARFVFLGDGPQKTALQAKALALGLGDKLTFLGWRRDGPQWLAAADAFALTSLWEGLPRALVEAMHTGLPSVCYATDGVTDVLVDGQNGFLVEPGDVDGFAEKLVGLLTDADLRRRLGARAAASIGSEFDIDGMVRAQEALYERLLDERRV
ncbi:MAG: glycosyltransferase family 4 protein [Elusimicrobia bacterium]|nr:glycosyltransferase family 4 protein [Elusimicrobiota bacterium]